MTNSNNQTLKNSISGNFEPNNIEPQILDFWFDNKMFKFTVDKNKPNYSIVIPPPNITGQLHMGHALNGTIQDMLIRYKRMLGFNVLWQPGTDHAGISTQMVVERKLKAQGLSRHKLGRQEFLKHVWDWRNLYGNHIVNQYKSIGVSFDFERLAFTMDDDYVKAIYKAFVDMYHDNLIYRGHRVSNWCPSCLTSLSDLEVEHKQSDGHLYHLKYHFENSSDYLTIATTRPETIFADVAVAVNPKDERYQKHIGLSVKIPLTNRLIKVIADDYVDLEFGTGILKITPAHDTNDFEIGQRHNLPLISIIDVNGKLITCDEVPTKYHNIERFSARRIIEQDLADNELLDSKIDYKIPLGYCERCQTAIEPLLSKQWYVAMDKLAKLAINCVEQNEVEFIPKRYKNTYLDWLYSIKDWCVSRQLWWGHRIPIWTCDDCQFEDAFETQPDKCPKCNSINFNQDEDVLDTWFSSSLWPMATLGWPQKDDLLNDFFPTNVLSTAREIINLWVARMIFMSKYFLNQVPFREVLIHPVIQTSDGKRMSKSKGNAIDPMDMIAKYGCDANRFWFCSVGIKGDQDVRFREDKLDEYKRFNNKIWNASKFILNTIADHKIGSIDFTNLTLADKFVLNEYNKLIDNVNTSFENYDFETIANEFYEFFWNTLCDWYLEINKIYSKTPEFNNSNSMNILYYILESSLRLIHPVMPFITESIWQSLPKSVYKQEEKSIMLTNYPQKNQSFNFDKDAQMFLFIIKIIKSIRNTRQTFNVANSSTVSVYINCVNRDDLSLIKDNCIIIENLSKTKLSFDEVSDTKLCSIEKINDITITMPLGDFIDVDKTKVKIEAQLNSVAKELAKNNQILNSGDFITKAPKDKIETIKNKIEELNQQVENFTKKLAIFK